MFSIVLLQLELVEAASRRNSLHWSGFRVGKIAPQERCNQAAVLLGTAAEQADNRPALVTLADLDERLAGLHAARLIPDPQTSSMSGEPALTAVHVLVAQDQLAVLYGWLASAGPKAP